MDRDWEMAAYTATKSLQLGYTEEAFCSLMKALDNICAWEHPLRDLRALDRLLAHKARSALEAPHKSSLHTQCYNAGTAALITELSPELSLLVARGEMAIIAASATVLPQRGGGWTLKGDARCISFLFPCR